MPRIHHIFWLAATVVALAAFPTRTTGFSLPSSSSSSSTSTSPSSFRLATAGSTQGRRLQRNADAVVGRLSASFDDNDDDNNRSNDTEQFLPDTTLLDPSSLLAMSMMMTPWLAALPATAATTTTFETLDTTTQWLAAGPIPSALWAWLHFVGILGVAGGLVAERLLIQKQMSIETEQRLNLADGIYGLAALSLLVSGYFRATGFAKGWEFYQHSPIFWLKMAGIAILGGLSLFPAAVLFRRDRARQNNPTIELAPLSDALVERMTTIINAELLAVASIPLLASLMARGVGYMDNFPWPLGVALYVGSLGGAGFKYGKEAFAMMESEGALEEVVNAEKEP